MNLLMPDVFTVFLNKDDDDGCQNAKMVGRKSDVSLKIQSPNCDVSPENQIFFAGSPNCAH